METTAEIAGQTANPLTTEGQTGDLTDPFAAKQAGLKKNLKDAEAAEIDEAILIALKGAGARDGSDAGKWVDWADIVRKVLYLLPTESPDRIVARLNPLSRQRKIQMEEKPGGMFVCLFVPRDRYGRAVPDEDGLSPQERRAESNREAWDEVKHLFGGKSAPGNVHDDPLGRLERIMAICERQSGRGITRTHPGLIARRVAAEMAQEGGTR